jgi:hypothetical protein
MRKHGSTARLNAFCYVWAKIEKRAVRGRRRGYRSPGDSHHGELLNCLNRPVPCAVGEGSPGSDRTLSPGAQTDP